MIVLQRQANETLNLPSSSGSRRNNESSDDNARPKQKKRPPRDDPSHRTNHRGSSRQRMRTAKDSFICTVVHTGKAKNVRTGRSANRSSNPYCRTVLPLGCILRPPPPSLNTPFATQFIQLAHNTHTQIYIHLIYVPSSFKHRRNDGVFVLASLFNKAHTHKPPYLPQKSVI